MKGFILACVSASAIAATYNGTQAMKGVYLSSYTYCGPAAYSSITFQSPVQGFQVTSVIDDPVLETAGYVGYLPSDNSIYVAFRGSENIPNWLSDFDTTKTAYTSWPECNC